MTLCKVSETSGCRHLWATVMFEPGRYGVGICAHFEIMSQLVRLRMSVAILGQETCGIYFPVWLLCFQLNGVV